MDDKNQQVAPKINRNLNPDTTRILYSDDITMTINKDSVVFDFGQRIINTNQIQIVSRLGMTREFAKDLYKLLNNLLSLTEGQMQTETEKKKN